MAVEAMDAFDSLRTDAALERPGSEGRVASLVRTVPAAVGSIAVRNARCLDRRLSSRSFARAFATLHPRASPSVSLTLETSGYRP